MPTIASPEEALAWFEAHSDPVDLLLRTGGERRLSDFLLWECAYAELLFLDVLWPDVNAAVLDAAFAAADEADLLVAIGTSLQVNPVAGLAGVAGTLAIVNAEATPYDDAAEVVVRDSISDVLDEVRICLA